jgi:hypothetical protein
MDADGHNIVSWDPASIELFGDPRPDIITACNAHEELVAALRELVAANNAIDRARMPSLREYRPDYTPIYMGIHRAQAVLDRLEKVEED